MSLRSLKGSWWERIRRAAFERDGWRCCACGRPGRLEAHHVTPLHKGGERVGVGHDPSRGAAYVEGWVAALEEDPREIRRAAADGQPRPSARLWESPGTQTLRERAWLRVSTSEYGRGYSPSWATTELCAAYAKPYVDVSSDILADDPVKYGGQVCVALSGNGCLSCMNVLDSAQAAIDLAGPEERRRLADIYGVSSDLLDNAGPSVVSINGVVASLAVTEFMLGVTGLRNPNRLLTYHGLTGKVTVSTDDPLPDCYYCKGLWGRGDHADVQRYIQTSIAEVLR